MTRKEYDFIVNRIVTRSCVTERKGKFYFLDRGYLLVTENTWRDEKVEWRVVPTPED